MLSLKENFYETMKGKDGKPDAFVPEWKPFPQVWDPVFYYQNPAVPGGPPVKNPLGVTLHWGEDEPGAMPIVTDETKVVRDVTKWRDYVEFFDLRDRGLDWTQAKADAEKVRADDKFVMVWNVNGLFEMSHFLMGFEDTLMNLLEEPDAMHDLIEAMKNFKLSQIEYMIDELKPDVFMTHDDWGSKTSLFMSPGTWREFYKEPWREIFSLIKSKGCVTMHHSDSFCEPIVKDMVEIGLDIWQGVLPTNDIQRIKKETDGKLVLMGGIDVTVIDVPNWTEEMVRTEVARACKDYHEGGVFIPAMTMGGEGSLFPGVDDVVVDEIQKQSKIYFK
ncbi:MAG: uroporphyrinogen decarboxylase (URO-D) [Oscillospiraceae bacterium]|nr:uroporphyrinogen decarboxylase (URO-D) [Oscillospiraceae bacterium]